MICHDCGHKNDSDAKFCEECGTKLIKPVQTKIDDNQIIDWWNNRDSNNAKGFIILISVIIGLTVLASLISAMSPSQDNKVVPFGNDTGTFYDSEYLSFSHNKMYKIDTGDKNYDPSDDTKEIFNGWDDPKNTVNIVGETEGRNFTFVVTVYKPINATKSAYDYALTDKNELASYYPTTSIKEIQIANVTGYKYDADFSDSKYSLKERYIFFVKNNKLYKIKFGSEYNKLDTVYQDDINKIISSFTVK